MASGMNVLDQAAGEGWALYNADCVTFARGLPEGSVGFSVYSPPFANLYVYSDSALDMGNCSGIDEFVEQYRFIVEQVYRATAPGRLSAVHCMDIPLFKWKDGEIALSDFPGRIIAAHRDAGFAFHSRVTIWKDPVVEMQRTKALGLLYKQLQKDSAMSRQGLPDYLVVFRKPGENARPIAHDPAGFPVSQWQEWASPVWTTVRQTRVLDVAGARAAEDEKHVCPLQLDVIERAIRLWSNPGDVVFSPFAGIGSEGWAAVRLGRRFVGTELKPQYFRQAVRHLAAAAAEGPALFDGNAA